MTITPLPTPPSRNDGPDTFTTKADAFIAALPTFVTEANSLATSANQDASDAATSANNAAMSASEAAASATDAAASAAAAALEAAEWVSGASYTQGDVVWSSVDYGTYRAKTTHSGETTDPSSDTTNWAIVAANDLASLGVTFTVGANGETTFVDGVNEGFASVTSTSNATTIDCRDGNVFAHTLTENTTFTFSSPPTTGTAYGFVLKVVQDSTPRTITWPASVDWSSALSPDLSSGSGDVDVFVFFTHDGGTNWYGFIAGQGLA